MENNLTCEVTNDWLFLKTFLPSDWEDMCVSTKAMIRKRNFDSAESLLRVLLIHIGEGLSLRETVLHAEAAEIASVSDVALLKRLKKSGEWLRMMAEGVMRAHTPMRSTYPDKTKYNLRIVDGTTIQEPGSKNATWRIHYSINLKNLFCDEFKLTDNKKGETFSNFTVNKNDIIIGDRGYAQRAGIAHVFKSGGHVLQRVNLQNVPFIDSDGNKVILINKLRTLKPLEVGEWPVFVEYEGLKIPGRICAIKKTRQAAEKSREKVKKENGRKGAKVKPETIEAAGYIFIFTTLRELSTSEILEIYRSRWQVELVFKRLKSILGIGCLKKKDPDAAKAWLYGKLLIAFLIESLLAAGELFSPWGYRLSSTR
ncbi:MAG TPA: IS4 family transposase [Desulfomicrobiaceae bacterium]|nr:IS4 family transposase [Desulfomicrobiaceae bacterium]